jgi:hypothetical protein
MKDKLIDFETAKLAKEKECRLSGYPEMYNQDGDFDSPYKETYPAYTQSLLQRWLREKHGLNLYIALSGTKEISWFWSINDRKNQSGSSKTYEQALEAGLQETLKLIKV